jgi:hypothetical protein
MPSTLQCGVRATLVDLARAGCRDEVRAAVLCGANADAADEWGQTALMCMASQGAVDMVQFLLGAGANPLAVSMAPGRQGMHVREQYIRLVCSSHMP